MSDSLRDQLLKSGLVQKLKAESAAAKARQGGKQPSRKPKPAAKPADGEIDLASAYGLRERSDRQQREQEQRAAEEKARQKAESKRKLGELLAGKALNQAEAEVPRHFPHGSKIRRIYCTPEQLAALNAGELGVVQQRGRYLLVTREVASAAAAISADALVLLVEPGAVADDGVPDDLVW